MNRTSCGSYPVGESVLVWIAEVSSRILVHGRHNLHNIIMCSNRCKIHAQTSENLKISIKIFFKTNLVSKSFVIIQNVLVAQVNYAFYTNLEIWFYPILPLDWMILRHPGIERWLSLHKLIHIYNKIHITFLPYKNILTPSLQVTCKFALCNIPSAFISCFIFKQNRGK